MCFLCLGYFGWAQTQYSYYLVEDTASSLEPQSITENPDKTLSLSFTDSSLNSFFQNKTIYEYEKAFPQGVSTYLDRVYKFSTNNPNYTTGLSSLSAIEYIDLEVDGEPLLEPNDPYYVAGDIGKTYLELVRANKAWDITTGDPNVIVGIVDTSFELSHEDLVGQLVWVDGPNSSSNPHGTYVAGFVSPKTNNNIGIAGIGYNTRMLGKTGGLSTYPLFEFILDNPNVKIVNASWLDGCNNPNPIKQEIYNKIRNHYNVLVVAAAGNGDGNGDGQGITCGNPNNYVYPASYDNVLSVSSVGHRYAIGDSGMYNWRDVHQVNIESTDPESWTHQHNDKVDIVATGYDFRTTGPNNTYSFVWHGTSSAAPQVAAAAALVWSVKPTLTANEVEDILKSTADDIYWIPYNEPYIGKLGSGRLNVFRAVKTAECLDEAHPVVELVVRDSNEDIGNEPNNETSIFWNSNDIWVRNQDDGRYNDTHQDVEYSPTTPNYVYARVTNYGCQTSSGEDELKLYWSAAGTSQPWPQAWDGSAFLGGPIGTETIPELAPGQEAVLEFEWYPPNPVNYPGGISLNGNFSLLGRIISTDDPITNTSGSNITSYVKKNNNVALKNVNVVNISPLSPKTSASFMIANLSDETQTYSLELEEMNPSVEKALYEEAEIGIVMDSLLYEKWTDGGNSITDAESTKNPYTKLVSGTNPEIGNLTLDEGESGVIEFTFNFLTQELIEKENYEYNVIQKNQTTGEIVGGATIMIDKENREAFLADAEATENSNSTTLVADNTGESAVYNWYDSDGNLIYSGTELTVSPEITKTYKLEIISNLDGFKDYKEIEVSGNSPYSLGTLVPNPVSSQLTVSYDASSATSAYLIITNTITAGSENYILNTANNQVNINLSNYPSGIYSVTLVCNGAIVDSKNLVKN